MVTYLELSGTEQRERKCFAQEPSTLLDSEIDSTVWRSYVHTLTTLPHAGGTTVTYDFVYIYIGKYRYFNVLKKTIFREIYFISKK